MKITNKQNSIKYFILIALLSVLFSCQNEAVKQVPYDLKINEGFTNPLGFYDESPSFSWKLPDGVQSQSAYSIVVASSPDLLPENADLWQSGKIETDQNLYISYEGEKLSSRQKVFWQIKFWDNEGNESNWSEKAFFELGLLSNSDWQARWISLPDEKAVEIPEIERKVFPVQYLRKSIKIQDEIKSARIYITALGLFQAYINGSQVGDDALTPGWTSYQKRIETLTYDVSSLLKKGENSMGLELAEGWYSGRLIFRSYAELSPQVLAQLEVEYKNGEKEIFITDNTWKGAANGPTQYSSIYDGESYDANLEMPGWSSAGFDDSAWATVAEQVISDSVKIVPKRHNPVATKITLPTLAISEPVKGNFVFDLGQNMAGVAKINIPVKKGQKVIIRVAEMLQSNGEIYTQNYRSAVSTDFYLPAKDGVIEWQPKFTFHGFRYVELSGFDESATP